MNAGENGHEDAESPPPDLLEGGRSLWRRVLGTYDLGPAEVTTLAQACRLTDRLDTYANLIASEAILSEETGKLSAVLAQERLTSVALVKVLSTLRLPDLPDEDEGSGTPPAPVVPMTDPRRRGTA
jgi:hypothetical protein